MKKQGSTWRTLLSRWLSGRITAREEQELDHFAQKDPFLSDALQGYRLQPEGDHEKQVDNLKTHFLQEKKKRGFPLLRVAAAIAVLILAGVAMWQINSTGSQDIAQMDKAMEENLSLPEESAPVPSPVPSEEMTSEQINDEADKLEESIVTNSKPPQPSPTEKKPVKVREASPTTTAAPGDIPPQPKSYLKEIPKSAKSEAIAADQIAKEKIQAKETEPMIALEEEKTEESPDVQAYDRISARSAPSPPPSLAQYTYFIQTEVQAKRRRNQRIQGTILNEYGSPAPGIKVSLPDASKSITTDQDGQFILSIPSTAQQIQLTFNNQEKMIRIGKRDSFALNLNTGSGITVTAMRDMPTRSKTKAQDGNALISTRRPETKASAIPPLPSPSIDSTAYRQYIKENLQYPESAKTAGVSGEVKLRFSFDAQGKPDNIFVIKSLGYGCDKEAIRLLKEGPVWIAFPGSVATYTIRFDR